MALNPAYSASPACRALQGKGAEAWAVAVNNGVLELAGTDPRGLAYALISLSLVSSESTHGSGGLMCPCSNVTASH